MKVTDNIKVDFHHNIEEGISACIIEAFGEKFEGIAQCSKDDHFDRRVGRKIALLRAIKVSTLTREGRTKVWEALRRHKVKLSTEY